MTLDELEVGREAVRVRTVAGADIQGFAAVRGDHNPVHLDEAFARTTPFGGRIAHGMLSAAWISALIAGELPGPGSIYLQQSLGFRRPVRPGDEVTVRVAVTHLDRDKVAKWERRLAGVLNVFKVHTPAPAAHSADVLCCTQVAALSSAQRDLDAASSALAGIRIAVTAHRADNDAQNEAVKQIASLSETEREYEAAVKILEETTGRWNRDWKAACDVSFNPPGHLITADIDTEISRPRGRTH